MGAPTRRSRGLRLPLAVGLAVPLLTLGTAGASGVAGADAAHDAGPAPTSAQLQAAREELSASSDAMVAAVAALRAAEAELVPARTAAADARRRAAQARTDLDAARQAQRDAQSAVLSAAAGVERARAAARAEDDRLGRMARDAYMGGPRGLGWLLSAQDPAELGGRAASLRRVVAAQRVAVDAADLDADRLAAGEDLLGERRDAAALAASAAADALEALRAGEAAAAAALSRVDAAVTARERALAAARAAQEEDALRYAALQAESEATRARLRALAEAGARVDAGTAEPTGTAEPNGTAEPTGTAPGDPVGTTAAPLPADVGTGAAHGDTRAVPGVLVAPVEARVTSRFGMRVHPITGVLKEHTGLDLGAPCGTPVAAAAAGRVVDAGTVRGYGMRVVVAHAPVGADRVRLSTTYNHLSRIDVAPGDDLGRGETLGLVGSTGYSTGCHLHFEVLAGDDHVDPEPWLP